MRSRIRWLLSAAAIALAAVAGTACSAVSSPAKTATVTETGATALLPLMSSWQVAYEQAYPHVSVLTAGTGSGTGILDAATGLVSIGGSDAYLPASVPATGLLNIPLAVSALTVAWNLPGVHSLRLDGTVLAQMYSGVITRWDDRRIVALNPGVKLPALPIVTVHRLDSSGSTNLFTSYLNAQSPSRWPAGLVGTNPAAWPAAPHQIAAKGSSAVVAACEHTRGCVAYVGISYLQQMAAGGLRVAALANRGGQYVMPSRASVRTALGTFAGQMPPTGVLAMINGRSGYPVINFEYGIVQKAQPSTQQAGVVRAFLHWALTTGNGNQYMAGVDFVALPANVRAVSEQLAGSIH
jgi:phosphate transport system substrate-binding protein